MTETKTTLPWPGFRRSRGRLIPDPPPELMAKVAQGQVRGCLAVVTDLQREAVTLGYYDGYTYPEIAEGLNAKLPTIKARIRDGLLRLRDCLKPAVTA